ILGTQNSDDSINPIDNSSGPWCFKRSISSLTCSKCVISFFASSYKILPSFVNCKWRVLRSNNVNPNFSSKFLIDALKDGCDKCSNEADAVNVDCSTTVTK